MAEWWETFFDEDYVAAWEAAGVFDDTERQVEDLCNLLALPSGSAVLDAPCGFGRIAGPLHERGFAVTGIDRSATQLRLARERHPGPRYLEHDMRRPPPGPFDAVLNIFSSFGYFADPYEDLLALAGWHRVLAPGGQLVMTLNHRDHFVTQLAADEPLADDRLTETREVDWVAGVVTTTVTDGTVSKTFSVRLYTVTELVRLLQGTGFAGVEAFGGLDRRPVGPDTRLVLLARR